MSKERSVKVAIVQATPAMFDTPATVRKACALIKEAGANGAKLMLFPEAFVGGYPKGMYLGVRVGMRSVEGRKDYRRYHDNAILIPGPETDEIGRAVAQAGAYVVLGVIEKEEDSSTVYCTALFFGPDGTILGKHRKIKPTAGERYIWGEGDGSTLPVFDTPYGKIGAVICWENYMPLLRAAMYGKGVRIYLAPTFDARDSWQISMRHIALEGHCFVITCNQYLTKSAYPTDLCCYEELADQPEVLHRGGSAVINPYGEYLAGPIWDGEGVAYAELDLGQVEETRFDFDVVGHYTRPDVLQLKVNEAPQATYIYENGVPCCDPGNCEEEEE
ncbi:MAG: carbon-nitrogen hydrolase family protein [Peptococcaceae bacterium]|nr:carbon-nitrogen hydrolase family protein [Peptococcaceae bacterium]